MSMVAFEDDGFVTEVIHAKWARVPADPAGSAARGRPSPAGTRRQHPRGSSGTGGKSSYGSRPVSDPLTRGHEEGTGGSWRAQPTACFALVCASREESVPVSMMLPPKVSRSTIAAQSRASANVFVRHENESLEAIATVPQCYFLPFGQNLEKQFRKANACRTVLRC